MATSAAERETIAQQIMRLGTGTIAIANPRGAGVDAILVKQANCHIPANGTAIYIWYEYTGDGAKSAYGL